MSKVEEEVEHKVVQQVVSREGSISIQASMPGTFYTRPSPDKPPFVVKGTKVTEGQSVGLIEVMKTFSTIKAPISGIFEGWEKADGASILPSDVLGWIEEPKS